MKTYSLLRLIAGFVILALLFSACTDISQPNDDITLEDQNLPYHWRAWMYHVPDSLYLSQITIPGTHDAGADKHSSNLHWCDPKPYIICQDFNMQNQMKLGVRWFDIRLNYHDEGELSVHHDKYYLNKNFDDVLSWSIDFLNEWHHEIIILMIKQEHSSVSDYDFGEAVFKKMENHGLNHFYLEKKVPTIAEARGKIYIVRRFVNHTGNKFGVYVDWPNNTTGHMGHYSGCSIYAQDHYSLNTVSTDTKYDEVVDCIKKAHENTDHNTFYINFVSGERVIILETLWETAKKINYRVEEYLDDHAKKWHHCGIIMINFAGGGDSKSKRNCAPYLVEKILYMNPGIPYPPLY